MASLFAATALAACGGGDDDDGTPAPTPAPAPGPAPAPAPGAPVQTVGHAMQRAIHQPAGSAFEATLPFVAYSSALQMRQVNLVLHDVMALTTSHSPGTHTTPESELRGAYLPSEPDVHFRAEYNGYQMQWRGDSHVLRLDGQVSGRLDASLAAVDVAAGSSIRIREQGRDDRYTNWQAQYRGGALSHSYSLTAQDVEGLAVRTLQTVRTIKPFDPDEVPTEGMQQGVSASGYTVTLEYTPQGPVLR